MSLEHEQEEEQQAEDQRLFVTKGLATGDDAEMPPEGVVMHKVHKTTHKATDECEAS